MIETGTHLSRCLFYIDLNMVRAGVVQHPEEWQHGGYRELDGKPPARDSFYPIPLEKTPAVDLPNTPCNSKVTPELHAERIKFL